MAKKKQYDLYTFVAGAALEKGEPFFVNCNCSGTITILPPFQEEFVVCPKCESTIKMLVIEGDPGFIVGRAPDGRPTLLPVQGSSVKLPTGEEYERVIRTIEDKMARVKNEK